MVGRQSIGAAQQLGNNFHTLVVAKNAVLTTCTKSKDSALGPAPWQTRLQNSLIVYVK